MTRKLRLAFFLGLSMCATSLAIRAQDHKDGQLPEWKPAEALLPKLDTETKVEQWAIRPPKGCRLQIADTKAERQHAWGAGSMGLTVLVANRPSGLVTLENSMEGAKQHFRSRLGKIVFTPSERGIVNGTLFIRTRFSADKPAHLPGTDKTLYGFMYVTHASEHPIVLVGMALASEVELAEASAQTFHFVKVESAPK